MNEHPGVPGHAIDRVGRPSLPVAHVVTPRGPQRPPQAPQTARIVPNPTMPREPWYRTVWGILGLVFGNMILAAIGWSVYMHNPALQWYAHIIVIFWILSIGTVPIVAIWRAGTNVVEELFED